MVAGTYAYFTSPLPLMQRYIYIYVALHIPEYDSWEAPGDRLKLLSSFARGERLGCRGWMVKQSVRVSWVTSAVDFIYTNKK